MVELERAKRKIRLQFLGADGVKAYARTRHLCRILVGQRGKPVFPRDCSRKLTTLRRRLRTPNKQYQVRIKQAELDNVEEAAKTLAQNAISELDKRFENVEILEKMTIFDPQLFPTDEDVLLPLRKRRDEGVGGALWKEVRQCTVAHRP